MKKLIAGLTMLAVASTANANELGQALGAILGAVIIVKAIEHQPERVYVQPQQIYVPQPVYIQQRPVYVQQPVYIHPGHFETGHQRPHSVHHHH